MTITSRIVSRWMHLPPAQTHDIVVTHNIPVPMPDGVTLFAEHYASRNGIRQPTILFRSPYGRSGMFGTQSARTYAERGFQVLVQSCRGTAGSGGEFSYARNEREDGLATIEWIKRQDWFSGELVMIGGSYLGFVQWAIAADAGPELKAIVPQITTADFNHFRFQGGSFTLETNLGWSTMMASYASSGLGINMYLDMWERNRRLEKAYRHLPLNQADRIIIGYTTKFYQTVLSHGPDDEYWKPVDFSSRVGEVTIPIYLMGGWYDLFLDWQLKDYQALRAAGRHPNLLIGPWTHGEISIYSTMTREAVTWLQAQLKGNPGNLREAPVRLFVMGANQWRDYPDWPPPAQNQRWYLQPMAHLLLRRHPHRSQITIAMIPLIQPRPLAETLSASESIWEQGITANWKLDPMSWSTPAPSSIMIWKSSAPSLPISTFAPACNTLTSSPVSVSLSRPANPSTCAMASYA